MTAAAIAKKVNIITDSDDTIVNVDLIEKGMNSDEAFERCNAVVVHGDELAVKN